MNQYRRQGRNAQEDILQRLSSLEDEFRSLRAASMNRFVSKLPAGQDSWTNVTFQNGWTNYDTATFGNASYRKELGNIVRLRGLIAGGTVGSAAFTLPVGYRIGARTIFPAVTFSSTSPGISLGRYDVYNDGRVIPLVANNTWISLAVIAFHAEA